MDILAQETTMSAATVASLMMKGNDTGGDGGRKQMVPWTPSMLWRPVMSVSSFWWFPSRWPLSLVYLEARFPYARCLTISWVIVTIWGISRKCQLISDWEYLTFSLIKASLLRSLKFNNVQHKTGPYLKESECNQNLNNGGMTIDSHDVFYWIGFSYNVIPPLYFL